MSRDSRHSHASARALAWDVLIACLDRGIPIQEALNHALSRSGLEARDRHLASELAYGFLRYKGRMDFLVRHYLSQPERTPKPVLMLMGMGAYELVFLRIPSYATLNSYVDLVKRSRFQGLAKVVNAVLRRIADLGDDTLNQELYRSWNRNHEQSDAAWFSLPPWLYDVLRKQCGYIEPQHFETLLHAPFLGVRVNRLYPDFDRIRKSLGDRSDLIVYDGPMFCLPPGTLEHVDSLVRQGCISLQGYGSYEALMRLEPGSWEYPLWEACCGRGTKTCALLESGLAPYLVSDHHSGRLLGLCEDIERLRLPQPFVFQAAAELPPPFIAKPRTIFLDVPCSGLGVLSRRPDIKWKLSKAQIQEYINVQQAMCDNAMAQLEPGGKLVYMTCTVNPQENEKQMERLARVHGAVIEDMQLTPWDTPWNERLFGAVVRKRSA